MLLSRWSNLELHFLAIFLFNEPNISSGSVTVCRSSLMNGSGQSLGIDRGSSALNIRLHAFLLLEIFTVQEFFFRDTQQLLYFFAFSRNSLAQLSQGHALVVNARKVVIILPLNHHQLLIDLLKIFSHFLPFAAVHARKSTSRPPWQCRSLFKLSLPQKHSVDFFTLYNFQIPSLL